MRTRQRENWLGAVASAMVALAAILAACSRDLSVNNLTLTPTPVTTADLVSSQGQCPLPPLAPTQSVLSATDDWDAQMLFFLNHGYRVIAHDRRGHGRSMQTGDGHDMDHYAPCTG